MKLRNLFIAVLVLCSAAFAQDKGGFTLQFQNGGVNVSGGTFVKYAKLNFASGCTSTFSGGALQITCTGGAGNPGGSANQIQFNLGGTGFNGFTMGGDCTIVVATGVITCTKTNGTAFATVATSGSASDLTVGTLAAGRGGTGSASLPTAGQMPIGNAGGTAYAPVTMAQDCTMASTGTITCTKTNNVAFATSATTDTTVASNISSGTLNCGRTPALTGDATTSAGSCATTVAKINGTALSGLSTGILKNTTATGVPSIAAFGDVVGLFGSGACSGLLKSDGTCVTGGTGTVTSVTTGAGSGLTAGTITTTGSLSLLTTCSSNQLLQWNGSSWVCATIGGTISGLNLGQRVVAASTSTVTTSGPIYYTDQAPFGGATFAARVQNCLNNLPAGGGTCDAQAEGITTTTATVTLSGNGQVLKLPPLTITLGNTFFISVTGNNSGVMCEQKWQCIIDASANGSAGTITLAGTSDFVQGVKMIGGRMTKQSGNEVLITGNNDWFWENWLVNPGQDGVSIVNNGANAESQASVRYNIVDQSGSAAFLINVSNNSASATYNDIGFNLTRDANTNFNQNTQGTIGAGCSASNCTNQLAHLADHNFFHDNIILNQVLGSGDCNNPNFSPVTGLAIASWLGSGTTSITFHYTSTQPVGGLPIIGQVITGQGFSVAGLNTTATVTASSTTDITVTYGATVTGGAASGSIISTPLSTDTGCSEGFQTTDPVWYETFKNNYISLSSKEGMAFSGVGAQVIGNTCDADGQHAISGATSGCIAWEKSSNAQGQYTMGTTVTASMVTTTATFSPSGTFTVTGLATGDIIVASGFNVSGYNVPWTIVTVSGSSITATATGVTGLTTSTASGTLAGPAFVGDTVIVGNTITNSSATTLRYAMQHLFTGSGSGPYTSQNVIIANNVIDASNGSGGFTNGILLNTVGLTGGNVRFRNWRVIGNMVAGAVTNPFNPNSYTNITGVARLEGNGFSSAIDTAPVANDVVAFDANLQPEQDTGILFGNLITGVVTNQGLVASAHNVELIQTCSNTQVLAYNGSTWACAANGGNPMTTLGDITYGGAAGVQTRLAGPTAAGTYFVTEKPNAGAATAETFSVSGVVPNPQTGTSYTYLATDATNDRSAYTTFSNASPVAVTLPQAGTTGFANNWVNKSCNVGTGTVTITPTTSTITYTDGGSNTSATSSVALTTGRCINIYSDNTNYFANLSSPAGTVTSVATTAPLGGGTITTTGALTCATCVVASSPGVGLAHFAGSTQTATSSAVNLAGADVTGILPLANMTQLFVTNAQTTTYQVLAADFADCKTIPVSSGTFTITLVASGAQPASGQCLDIINYGSGVVTVARSGQNINGGTTSMTVPAGSQSLPNGLHIVSDGTNYIAQPWSSGVPCTTTALSLQFNNAGAFGCVTPFTFASSTITAAAGGIFDMSAATTAPSVKLPAVIGGTILAGTSTANLSSPVTLKNTNSSNNNTSIGALIGAAGTSTGGIGEVVFDVSGTGDIMRWYSGGSESAGVYTAGTLEANITATGGLGLGAAPTCTAGTGGAAICATESSTDPASAASTFSINGNSNDHAGHWSSNAGTVQHLPQTAFNTSYTNATTGFTSITGLAFTVAASTNYVMTCNLTYQGSVSTTGLKVQVTGPASPTSVSFNYTQTTTTSATVAATFSSESATAFSSAMGDTLAITATTNMPAQLTMSLANGVNAGTVQVQGAADGTGTVTVQPSSCVLQ